MYVFTAYQQGALQMHLRVIHMYVVNQRLELLQNVDSFSTSFSQRESTSEGSSKEMKLQLPTETFLTQQLKPTENVSRQHT